MTLTPAKNAQHFHSNLISSSWCSMEGVTLLFCMHARNTFNKCTPLRRVNYEQIKLGSSFNIVDCYYCHIRRNKHLAWNMRLVNLNWRYYIKVMFIFFCACSFIFSYEQKLQAKQSLRYDAEREQPKLNVKNNNLFLRKVLSYAEHWDGDERGMRMRSRMEN